MRRQVLVVGDLAAAATVVVLHLSAAARTDLHLSARVHSHSCTQCNVPHACMHARQKAPRIYIVMPRQKTPRIQCLVGLLVTLVSIVVQFTARYIVIAHPHAHTRARLHGPRARRQVHGLERCIAMYMCIAMYIYTYRPYNHGVYIVGYVVMAYIVMAYIVMAYRPYNYGVVDLLECGSIFTIAIYIGTHAHTQIVGIVRSSFIDAIVRVVWVHVRAQADGRARTRVGVTLWQRAGCCSSTRRSTLLSGV